MIWFYQNGQQLFILFAFPLIGLAFDFLLNTKGTVFLLILALILLSPILTGYSYVFPYAYQFFTLIGLGCVYAFCSRKIINSYSKYLSAICISGLLCIILGWAAFIDAFSGSQVVEKKWQIDNYKIEYIRDQGFSGRPLMKYELNEFGFIPIFIKKTETVVDNDTTLNCNVNFELNKINFNKCETSITNY
jgi:hypothetical protein